MAANRNRRTRNDRAEVGIGTLIVFIAMVLVASVAAAVLVNTSGILQSRALSAGKASSDEVASNLKIVDAIGNRTAQAGNVRGVTLYVQLAAGGLPVNLDKVWIHYLDATNNFEIKQGPTATSLNFTRVFVRESGTPNSILEAGEVAKLTWIVDVSENERVRLTLNPESGQQSVIEFYAPTAFGSAADIALF